VTFGPSHDTLADFGIAPRKQAVTMPAGEGAADRARASDVCCPAHGRTEAEGKDQGPRRPHAAVPDRAARDVTGRTTVAKPDASNGGQHA
jgi:hypothetical protein